MKIREAQSADIDAIFEMIRGIAEYAKLSDQLEASPQTLREALFGERPAARALVAEYGDAGPVAYAIFCYNFSSFLCEAGIYLEDLYVCSEYRGKGIGKALFKAVAKIGVDEGCGRMEWMTLNWNEPALEFYKSQGAQCLSEWRLHRFDRAQLEAAAE